MDKGLSPAADGVCKCWNLFAYHPACVLLNCTADEHSRFMEAE